MTREFLDTWRTPDERFAHILGGALRADAGLRSVSLAGGPGGSREGGRRSRTARQDRDLTAPNPRAIDEVARRLKLRAGADRRLLVAYRRPRRRGACRPDARPASCRRRRRETHPGGRRGGRRRRGAAARHAAAAGMQAAALGRPASSSRRATSPTERISSGARFCRPSRRAAPIRRGRPVRRCCARVPGSTASSVASAPPAAPRSFRRSACA